MSVWQVGIQPTTLDALSISPQPLPHTPSPWAFHRILTFLLDTPANLGPCLGLGATRTVMYDHTLWVNFIILVELSWRSIGLVDGWSTMGLNSTVAAITQMHSNVPTLYAVSSIFP